LLGDVVICPAVAQRNAPDHAGNYDDELALLVVHGLLHILGMDHEDADEAEAMEARERELLARHHRGQSDSHGDKAGDDAAGPPAGEASS
ncbi:MAG TPA: rRNA maturation RNase YbeY, partial [Acidimicrobiales bacterium]|nr:rRNA maturation RNase YbeY [Acidimicrobiales bacterium]